MTDEDQLEDLIIARINEEIEQMRLLGNNEAVKLLGDRIVNFRSLGELHEKMRAIVRSNLPEPEMLERLQQLHDEHSMLINKGREITNALIEVKRSKLNAES